MNQSLYVPFKVLPAGLKKKIKEKLEDNKKNFKGKNYLIRGCTPIEERFIGNAYLFHPKEKAKVLKSSIPAEDPKTLTAACYQKTRKLDDTARMQYIDLKFWLIGDILQKADKMSMAHSSGDACSGIWILKFIRRPENFL